MNAARIEMPTLGLNAAKVPDLESQPWPCGKMREDLCQVMGAGCKGETAPKSQLPTLSSEASPASPLNLTYPIRHKSSILHTHKPTAHPHGKALPELSGAQGPACVSQLSSHSQLVLEPKNMLL